MEARAENFKFLFPLTGIAVKNGFKRIEHRTDLEIHYQGRHHPGKAGTDKEYHVEIDRVLTECGDDLRPLLALNEFRESNERIRAAAMNNVASAFEKLYEEEDGYEPVIVGKKWAS